MNKLGELFFAMPNEIQVQILCYLDATDILSLRETSKQLSELLKTNASVLLRVVLHSGSVGDDPPFIRRLYRPPAPVEDLDHFVQMMHRERIVLRMVSTIADYVQTKIYCVRTASRRKQFASRRARMERGLKAPTFVICHFLEEFRNARLRCPGGASSDCQRSSKEIRSLDDEIQIGLIKCYPEDVLLPAFHFYRIMVCAYSQKLRPPAYAGTIERKLRGWDRTPASDVNVAQVLMYGGMEDVLNIMLHSTYGARLQALDAAVDRINGCSPPIALRWKGWTSSLEITQDLDTRTISDTHGMEQGNSGRLTDLYLPWMHVMATRRRVAKGTDAAVADPIIPSPFVYIAELLQGNEAGTIPNETNVSTEEFVARTNVPDEDEEHTEDNAG